MEELISDEILGTLKYYNNAWCRRMDAPLFNSKGNLILVVQDDDKEGVLDVQRNAYNKYLQNANTYKSSVPQLIMNYYNWFFQEIEKKVTMDEEHHKDNITEELLYDMMSIWYLFICRDGSFGYAFGCCWDKDNGLAVLLSESEPRVISRTQLENLHKLNDPLLGLLVHNGDKSWTGLKQHHFFGELENLEIELEGGIEEGITSAQQKAYMEYLQKENEYFREFSKMMLTAYVGDPQQVEAMLAIGPKINVQTALPKTLYIDKKGNYGWICYTAWNKSKIGVLLSEKKIHLLQSYQLKEYDKQEKMIDEVCGLLFRGYAGWEKIEVVRLAGSVYTMPVTIRTYDDPVSDKQRESYKKFLKLNATQWEEIKDITLDYYLEGYDNFMEYIDIPDYLKRENVNRENVVKGLLEFTELFIKTNGRIAWLCECPTTDDGLAFEFTNGEIDLISQIDII
ncbi:MAG: hypothetical protein IJJ77_02435 [Paludibacteraceae bacterium]|nr:hypothetical protein [Paludibacteraceae bacterium]